MAEYLGSESELPRDELIPPVTSSIAEKNQNIAQAKPGNSDQNHDKFSALTPLVFNHILSFLGVNDLVRLCVVSARFQQRCVSSPNILFDLKLDKKSCTSKCRGLRNLLGKLLDVQPSESGLLKMNLFRLHWYCHECRDFSPTSVFHRWLKRAVVCNAQEINIGFLPDEAGFVLPDCLRRASAENLRLNLNGGQLNCQPKDKFASIRVLNLSSIRVPSGFNLEKWISSHFPSLKTLKPEKIRFPKYLSFTSSSLESLIISHCFIGSSASDVYACKINCISLKSLLVRYCLFQYMVLGITTPSLKDLQITKCSYVSCVYYHISAEALSTLSIDMSFFVRMGGIFIIDPRNLPSLKRVRLKLGLHEGLHDDSDEIRNHFVSKIGWLRFYPGLFNRTSVLEIDIDTIRMLVQKKAKLILSSLRHLEVTTDDMRKLHAPVVVWFLGLIRSKKLRTLKIIYAARRSDRNLSRVVESLKSRVGKELPAKVKITWLKRPLTIARDGALKCMCPSCILSSV